MFEIPKYGGWGRERFVHLENGHFASIDNYDLSMSATCSISKEIPFLSPSSHSFIEVRLLRWNHVTLASEMEQVALKKHYSLVKIVTSDAEFICL